MLHNPPATNVSDFLHAVAVAVAVAEYLNIFPRIAARDRLA